MLKNLKQKKKKKKKLSVVDCLIVESMTLETVIKNLARRHLSGRSLRVCNLIAKVK